MFSIVTFLFSGRRSVYAKIARENNCRALYVYNLAHGRIAKKSAIDFRIMCSLKEYGIVSWYTKDIAANKMQ